ncbi:MAG: hypothetical protein K0S71_2961 [Clostridia bacterium]|jgi:hypothetical protein|nr:hypothetical protein [Clostridia bacterium]
MEIVLEKGGIKMSDINKSVNEGKENESSYIGENYQAPFNRNASVPPQMVRPNVPNNDRGPNNRADEAVNQQNTQGYGSGYRSSYNNPYATNYNAIRGEEDMNYQSNYQANYQPNYERNTDYNYTPNNVYDNCYDYYGDRPFLSRWHRFNMRNRRYGYGRGYRSNYNTPYPINYNAARGEEDMNYQTNYPANYQPYYERDDDDCYYPHHYNYGPCCDYYDSCRPYYNRGNRYNMRYSGSGYGNGYGYGRPNMQGYDPNCYPTMPQNTMWNANYISDFISRPRVNNFLRGVGIATIGLMVAPAIARTFRPVLVKTVQGAMVASDEIKGVFSDAKEDVEDIFADAKWGANNENNRNGHGSHDM